MELLHQFGFDPILLLAQIVNFVIVLWVLKKFLYKPVLTMLEERKRTIEEGLEKAERAQKLLEEIEEKEKNILKKAQQEALRILEDARNSALNIAKKAEEDALKQSERIIKETKEQIAQETQEVEKRLTLHISTIAVEFLKKTVGDLFTEETQEKIMQQAIKELKHKPN